MIPGQPQKAYISPCFSDSIESIHAWSGRPLSWKDRVFSHLANPSLFSSLELPCDDFIEERVAEVARVRAIWNARHVFRHPAARLAPPDFWAASPLVPEEFATALFFYYKEEKAKLKAFQMEYRDLVPSSSMTEEQQSLYRTMLAIHEPQFFAKYIRRWTSSEPQIVEAVDQLKNSSPKDLVFIGVSDPEMTWGDGKVHPELAAVLEREEKKALIAAIESRPEIIHYWEMAVTRLNISFSQEESDRYFSIAVSRNPIAFSAYRKILNPSREVERKNYEWIFETGAPGAVDLFKLLNPRFSVEEEELYLDCLMRSCPERMLVQLNQILPTSFKERTFYHTICQDPNFPSKNGSLFREVFVSLSKEQRKNIIDIFYQDAPLMLKEIDSVFDFIPKEEAEEYRELQNLIAWRRLCIYLREHFKRIRIG